MWEAQSSPENDGVFYGKVQGIRSLISCEGTTVAAPVSDFHGAVDDYLALCEEEGTEPEVAYKGSFNIRIGSECQWQTLDASTAKAAHESTRKKSRSPPSHAG